MPRAFWTKPDALNVRHQTGRRLRVPIIISLVHLPPNSLELNAIENVRQYLRQNSLANRVFNSYAAVVDPSCNAWNSPVALPERIHSITVGPWAKTVTA